MKPESRAVRMVDVGDKAITQRVAKARAMLRMSSQTLSAITLGKIPKGDVLQVARIAAIQAAKETSRILPLCHPIPLESVDIDFQLKPESGEIEIKTSASANWKTGVEMEALTAASAAALTIYDMCKSIDRGMTILSIELLEKEGGRSGKWVRS